jgi:hypothetical protein
MKSKAPVPEANVQLRELATEIQDRYALCEQEGRTAVEHAQATMEHARAIGETLVAAKKLAGHGRWESWVEANLPFSIDKAERMMRLHKNWGRIKSAPEPILGIKQGIAYLTSENKKTKRVTTTDGEDAEEAAASRRTADPVGRDGGVAQQDDDTASTYTVQATCPNSEWSEFDEDGICVLCSDGAADEVVIEADVTVEDDAEPQSVRDCYVDPEEADFSCPAEPLGEDAADRLEVLLETMERPLTLMLEHEAIAALSEHDPLRVSLARLERAIEQVSAELVRKRPVCMDALQVA